MSQPTELHLLHLKRLVRYLVKYPTEQWRFDLQDEPDSFHIYCNSDWATCNESSKSMSCYAVKYGLHLLDTSCARQTVIALSFGEAEYYALTRGASAGLLVKGVYGEIGKRLLMICLTSSAAKGIASRKGVGKVKHLSLKELWVQDAIEQKRFKVQKVGTDSNWADLGTKVLDCSRILMHFATAEAATPEERSNDCISGDLCNTSRNT